MPAFTIITATWNRGRHILPTIRSVLGQSLGDFEYLVIGDCCTDDTETVVRSIPDPRLRWLSTTQRWRSQSGPNNLGIAQAQGDYIAYLGHDDLWSPDNLAGHLATLRGHGSPEFSVSGCITYGSPGTGIRRVSGLFDPGDLPERFFFPPSSIVHRRDICPRLGPWPHPDAELRNVDVSWFLRAQDQHMRFVSTGKVGCHKFTAYLRYLSYLDPSSAEQSDLLDSMARPGFSDEVASSIATARAQGSFSATVAYRDDETPAGANAARARTVRGVSPPPLSALGRGIDLPQDAGPRSHDWRPMQPDRNGFRWTGPNPAPRLLVPVTSGGKVVIDIPVRHPDPAILNRLRFRLNGEDVAASMAPIVTKARFSCTNLRILGQLLPDRASVLQVLQPAEAMLGDAPEKMRGIAVGELRIRPHGAAARVRSALGL